MKLSKLSRYSKWYLTISILLILIFGLIQIPQVRSFWEDFRYGPQTLNTIFLTLPNKKKLEVEVAKTEQEREVGLMFRKNLSPNRGMIFVFTEEDQHVFWMKNTFIDLDIIFIGADKHITSIASKTPRTTSDTLDSQIPRRAGYGQYVLEIPAGRATELGLEGGTKLDFSF